LGQIRKFSQLDTNALIGLVSPNQSVRQNLRSLLLDNHEFSVSAFAWHEFVSGPLQKQQSDFILSFIEERIIPIDREIAELAATLYNKTGRKKGSRPDCIIAATAIAKKSYLVTYNQSDFSPFLPFGLQLL